MYFMVGFLGIFPPSPNDLCKESKCAALPPFLTLPPGQDPPEKAKFFISRTREAIEDDPAPPIPEYVPASEGEPFHLAASAFSIGSNCAAKASIIGLIWSSCHNKSLSCLTSLKYAGHSSGVEFPSAPPPAAENNEL